MEVSCSLTALPTEWLNLGEISRVFNGGSRLSMGAPSPPISSCVGLSRVLNLR